MYKHPGRRITNDHLGDIFSKAYHTAASVEIACSGFHTSGIYPLCRDIIPDIDFNDDKRSNDLNLIKLNHMLNQAPYYHCCQDI